MEMLVLVVMMFLSVCFLTLLERKVLGYVQNRKGPVKVILFGLVQPVLDGGKLVLKFMSWSTWGVMYFSFLGLMVMSMLAVMISFIGVVSWVNNMVFYILIISSMMVYVLFILGWGSGNSYGILGGLRSSSQMISYEIVMFFVLILLVIYNMSWDLSKFDFNSIYIMDLFVIWMMIVLVETNRSPYDFAEGESELVSGYNVEYGGVLFAYIFIAEYGMVVFFSWMTSVMFFYSWFFWIILLIVVYVRGFVPRSRYDLLMMSCWKFIFILLSFLMFKFF